MTSAGRRAVAHEARRSADLRRWSSSGAGSRRITATCTAIGVVLSLLSVAAGAAAPAVPPVGVVDFYALTPVPAYPGVVPEQFAADDLSEMLARASGGRVVLIPRAEVQRAEAELGWHADDVLHFARLSELARALRADRLVVGWIAQFAVGHEPNGDIPFHGGGPITGFAVVVVQVFDAAEGRIVAETRAEGSGLGVLPSLVAEQTLHTALQPVAPSLFSTLASSGP